MLLNEPLCRRFVLAPMPPLDPLLVEGPVESAASELRGDSVTLPGEFSPLS